MIASTCVLLWYNVIRIYKAKPATIITFAVRVPEYDIPNRIMTTKMLNIALLRLLKGPNMRTNVARALLAIKVPKLAGSVKKENFLIPPAGKENNP
jgi:hypothetical protein